jgi:hypothetical protein
MIREARTGSASAMRSTNVFEISVIVGIVGA